jgi:hypothetical protein
MSKERGRAAATDLRYPDMVRTKYKDKAKETAAPPIWLPHRVLLESDNPPELVISYDWYTLLWVEVVLRCSSVSWDARKATIERMSKDPGAVKTFIAELKTVPPTKYREIVAQFGR